MKKILIFIVILAPFNVSINGQDLKPGTQIPQPGKGIFIKKAQAYPYLLYLPKNFVADHQHTYPLLLFLHGSGERGNDLELVKKNGTPGFVESMEDFPFVMLSPQCPEEETWDSERLMALVNEAIENYSIDTNRMYVTGLSMGGYGTFDLASNYPGKFAAILPVCGGGQKLKAEKLIKTPIWAFHGADDPVVPVSESKNMVEIVNKLGGNAQITILPGVGHNAWDYVYNRAEIYQWLLSHQLK